jgi:hypothetical protein
MSEPQAIINRRGALNGISSGFNGGVAGFIRAMESEGVPFAAMAEIEADLIESMRQTLAAELVISKMADTRLGPPYSDALAFAKAAGGADE